MTKVISLRKKKRNRDITPIRRERKSKNFESLSNEKYKILLLIISLVAILIGSLSFRFFGETQLTQFVSDSANILSSGQFKNIFVYLVKFDFTFILLSFFIGTSFLGSAISFVPIMLKCLYIGFYSGFLYNEFELKGVLFCILLLYPCFAITTTSLIFAGNENVYMSQHIFRCLNGKNSVDDISVKLYLLRYMILIAIDVISIIVTALMISFLGPKINII